jgi:serine O-acetyltransferase
MNRTIQADLYRYTACVSTRAFLKAMMIPGFRYTYFLRKASANKRRSIGGVLYRLLLRNYGYKYGFQIPAGTRIGEGLYLGHFGTIVINPRAIIGDNCTLGPGVTIGQTNRGETKGVPTLGDRVFLGTNCVIVGRVRIGNNVLVAPGAYVNCDVPDNSIVLGNPGTITPNANATAGYVNNVLEA